MQFTISCGPKLRTISELHPLFGIIKAIIFGSVFLKFMNRYKVFDLNLMLYYFIDRVK